MTTPIFPIHYEERHFRRVRLKRHRCVILEGIQGLGKTTAIKGAVAPFEKRLYITHRRSLARTSSREFGLAHYREVKDLRAHEGSLSIVINSLHKLNPTRYEDYVVILDEFTQVFRHLRGSTLEGYRPATFLALRHILQNARFVIAADADVNEEATAFLCALGEFRTVQHIHNGFANLPRELRFVMRPEVLTDEILAAVRAGHNVVVACDTLKRSNELFESLPRGCKSILINSETHSQNMVEAFIERPDAEMSKYQAVVYSPSLFTGFNLSMKEYVDTVFLFAEDTTLPAEDLIQAIHRVRHPKGPVRAFVTPKRAKRQTDKSKLERQLLDERAHPDILAIGLDDWTFNADAFTRAFRDYAVASIAREHSSRNTLLESFIAGLERQGYSLPNKDEALSNTVKPVRVSRENEITSIRNAQTPSHAEAQRLKIRQSLSTEEKAQLKRFAYYELNGHKEDELGTLVEFELEDLQRAVDNLEALSVHSKFTSWHRVLGEVEASYGGFLSGQEFNDVSLKPFAQACLQHGAELKENLKHKVPSKIIHEPGKYFAEYLRRAFNLKCDSRRRGSRNKRRNQHTLNAERWELMQRLLERRAHWDEQEAA